MNPANEPIPGLRRPTQGEQIWISGQWSEEVRNTVGNPGGKAARYIGIFLIAFSVAGAWPGRGNLGGALVFFALGCFCLFLSRVSVKRVKLRKMLLTAFEQGNYMVAPAVSTKIYSGRGESRRMGMLCASLPNGERVEGTISVPYNSIYNLLHQGVHRVPILLIQIPNYPKILAIPAPGIGEAEAAI